MAEEKVRELQELEKGREAEKPDGDTVGTEVAVLKEKVPSTDSKEEKDEEKPKPKPVNLIKLFRYATWFDLLLILFGAIAAIANGASFPLLWLFLGDFVNTFISQTVTSMFFREAVNMLNLTNVSCDTVLIDPNTLNTTTVAGLITANTSGLFSCVIESEFIAEVNSIAITFVGIGLAAFFVAYIQISFMQTAAERQVYKIRLKYYRAVLRQNIAWFDDNPTGEITTRLSDDINKIAVGIGDKLSISIQYLAAFVAGFIVAFTQEWRLTLFMLGLTPVLAAFGVLFGKITAAFTSREQKQYASAGAVAEEVLSSIRTVYAFGGEKQAAVRYDEKLKEARKLGAKKGLGVGASLGSVIFTLFAIYGCVFWFGAYLISRGITDGGDVLAVFFSVLIGALSLGQAFPSLQNLFEAAGAAGTIYETIDRIPPIDSSSDEGRTLSAEEFIPVVELKNVDFTYPSRPDVQVMYDVSLKVEPGQTVALVGPSGCGKSTTVQLIQRFYDVDNGEVLVGGVNIKELNLKWLRSHIGVVSQEPILFDTTIAENICYGREDATMEEIQEAAKNANAHDFIMTLPKGYETLVGEGGTQLSGGQKQRVAIARALVSNPKILLLDEATSALDTESEATVQEALDRAREGRTTIVIAHRLSTIQNADIIVSIQDGSVVETGSHSELMLRKGLYFDLVTAQSYGVDDVFVKEDTARLFSPKRQRSVKGSDSGAGGVQRQISFKRQGSSTAEGKEVAKRQTSASKKEEEEADEDIPEVSMLRVIRVNAKEWWMILLGSIGSAINGSINPLFAVLFGEIFRVFGNPNRGEVLNEIHPWAGLFLVFGVVSGLAIFFKIFCFDVAGERLTARLRSLSFKAMLRQEIGWYDEEKNSTGALTTRLANDAGQVKEATGNRIGSLIETFVGAVLALGIAFGYSWIITLVVLGTIPFLGIALTLSTKAVLFNAESRKKNYEVAGRLAVDSIENVRTVASLTIEDGFFVKYKTEVKKPYRHAVSVNPQFYALTYGLSPALIFFMFALIYRFGAFLVTLPDGHILQESFMDVFTVSIVIIFGTIAVAQASAFAPNYARAKISANRIFFLLDRQPVIDNYSEDGEKLDKVSGAVTVKDVQFSYPARPDVQVLQGLSLSLSPGKTLALVGPSGCGKSTVVSLIERFYDPSAGSLTLENFDLRDLNLHWLRSQIGIVSQEPVLFDASIAENIRYGALFREVSDEEVIEAAKSANIHSFIESLPQGYNTNVGAKGTQLSGGQKQRIAIARALIRDPKILLLDEATSALDTESEKVVQEALDKAREGRTSIVIAHRLSTIYGSDQIAVIKGGKVVEQGTHSELLAKKGIYYKLNRYQTIASGEQEGVVDEESTVTKIE